MIKKITVSLVVMLSICINPLRAQITYDFETDVIGAPPANVSATNGTITTIIGNAMQSTSVSSRKTAAFNIDLFNPATNYSVTWKEVYTTAGRSGFTLRGHSSNSKASGLVMGYLFQANPSLNNAAIYTSNPSGYTRLGSKSLVAPGAGVPRWYRATVDGSKLTFEYSHDGKFHNNKNAYRHAIY